MAKYGSWKLKHYHQIALRKFKAHSGLAFLSAICIKYCSILSKKAISILKLALSMNQLSMKFILLINVKMPTIVGFCLI